MSGSLRLEIAIENALLNKKKIAVLLKKKIIVKTDYGSSTGYKCKCGYKFLQHFTPTHLNQPHHIKWMEKYYMCDICCTTKYNFYTCVVCENKHCKTCNSKVSKCPFCRSELNKSGEFSLLMRERQLRKLVHFNLSQIRNEFHTIMCYFLTHKNIFERSKFNRLRERVFKKLLKLDASGFTPASPYIELLEIN